MKDIHDLDALSTSLLHKRIIQKKPFLRKLYVDFYREFKDSIPDSCRNGLLVEIGSGGGFIKEVLPNTITSDMIDLPGLDKKFSALEMPFENNTVDAFFMIDVLHHTKDVRMFFTEVNRCLKKNGKLIMIEPAATMWSRFIYCHFHHERFDPYGGWDQEEAGRLSLANLAIPWIVFYRDRTTFEALFPSLKIRKLKPHTPFRYLISGGLSFRQILPSFTYSIVKAIEIIAAPFNEYLGMFLTIEIEKR
ncbi:MAG: class I SAM-dependent methyltransferase [Candidatus Omnitrophota bacterium]